MLLPVETVDTTLIPVYAAQPLRVVTRYASMIVRYLIISLVYTKSSLRVKLNGQVAQKIRATALRVRASGTCTFTAP